MTQLKQRLLNTLNHPLMRPWRKDESGIAAMEFAIIAPLIIGAYLGLAELSLILSAERQISHSASVAGDLATQVTTLTATDSADLMSAVLRVANIPDTNNFAVHMESFERESDGTVTSLGEVVYNPGQSGLLEDFDVDDLGRDMLNADSGIFVARVGYRYRPLGFTNVENSANNRSFLPTTVTLNETFLLKARRSDSVEVGTAAGTKFTCRGSATTMRCS